MTALKASTQAKAYPATYATVPSFFPFSPLSIPPTPNERTKTPLYESINQTNRPTPRSNPTHFRTGRGVVDVGSVDLDGCLCGFLPSASQGRHPALASFARAGDCLGFTIVVHVAVVLLEATTAAGGWLGVDDGGGPAAVDGGVEVLLFVLVEVGARVGGFVLEHLHEAVEARGE